jgi:hypothetical protein
MTTKELIQTLDLRHLRQRDVEAIEEAMNIEDVEVMLTLVDKLIGQSKKLTKKKKSSKKAA